MRDGKIHVGKEIFVFAGNDENDYGANLKYCSCLHARKAHRDAALIIEMLYQGYHHIENSSMDFSASAESVLT